MFEAKRDIDILSDMMEIFCKQRHRLRSRDVVKYIDKPKPAQLCEECNNLLYYSLEKRMKCPKQPKPSCKNCDIKCYGPQQKQKIKEIMRYSGKRYIFHGGITNLIYYLRSK